MVDREEIILFVKDRLGLTPTPETKFWWGTGIAGLDAWTFMEDYAERFGVDMQGADEGFDYGDGDLGIGDALQQLWRKMTFRSVPRTNHFTIDHLVQVANGKKWFHP